MAHGEQLRVVNYRDSDEWEPYPTTATLEEGVAPPEVLWVKRPDEDGTKAGYYRSGPMTVRSAPKRPEYVHVVEGSMVIDWEAGGQTTLKAGDNIYMPTGSGYVCKYLEPVVEYFVLY